jgi:uncharacterized damage-inducible protein DinB
MKGTDVLRTALNGTQHILTTYLSDLSDADLLLRPAKGANPIAWQLGHLIVSERYMGSEYLGAKYPELPAGFAAQHDKNKGQEDPPKGYSSKKVYLDLLDQVRKATLAALDKMTDADLDKPTSGKMASYAPTVGAMMVLLANHTMMHAGQFVPVRRQLGKPVLI